MLVGVLLRAILDQYGFYTHNFLSHPLSPKIALLEKILLFFKKFLFFFLKSVLVYNLKQQTKRKQIFNKTI